MYNLNHQLHFIGIGGVGMAGIAEILLNLGYRISGSDLKESALTKHLEQLGAEIAYGHRPENIQSGVSVVVVSSAIVPENPELDAARRKNIPVIPRAEMLAELMRMKYGIAVAGSHGKTTTTSMTARILHEVGLDPTVIVGGRVLSQTSGARLGMGQYLVAEADESDGSFCLLRPAIAVVTNVDVEHLTHYGSFGALEEAFLQFMSSVPFYGLVVACTDDPIVAKLVPSLQRRVLTFGLSPERDIYASDIEINGPISSYTLHVHGQEAARVELPMPGIHMVSNSLGAIAVAIELGANPGEAAQALANFPGVSRRSERVGEAQGVLVLDDYAHHPSEISATLQAVRRGWLPYHAAQAQSGELGRLIVIFEPHRYTRTRELFTDFLGAFGSADILYITDIYPAGEPEIPGVGSASLAAAIQQPAAQYLPSFEAVMQDLLPGLRSGDVVITLGAGAVGKVAAELVQRLAQR